MIAVWETFFEKRCFEFFPELCGLVNFYERSGNLYSTHYFATNLLDFVNYLKNW